MLNVLLDNYVLSRELALGKEKRKKKKKENK